MSSQTKQHTKKRARFRTELPADFKSGKVIRAKTTRYFKPVLDQIRVIY